MVLQTLRVINDCVSCSVERILTFSFAWSVLSDSQQRNKQNSLWKTRGQRKPAERFRGGNFVYQESNRHVGACSSWPTSTDLHHSFDNFRAAADARLVLFRVADGKTRTSTTKNRTTNPKWEVTPTPGTCLLPSSTFPIFFSILFSNFM